MKDEREWKKGKKEKKQEIKERKGGKEVVNKESWDLGSDTGAHERERK